MNPKSDAYVAIRDLIFDGDIKPGTHLVERHLAERLQVSRVPVREALQRLVLERVLQYIPGKGLVTRIYDEQEVLDLYLFREPLEGMAARLCAQRADEVEVKLLEQLYAGMAAHVENKNIAALHQNDFEFHRAISRGSRSPRLIEELSDIYEECIYVTKTSFSPLTENMNREELEKMRKELLEEHLRVLNAVADRNGADAEEAARASVRAGVERFMYRFTSDRLRGLELATPPPER